MGVVHERVNALARALSGSAGKSPYPQATIRCELVRLLEGPEAQERDRWLIAAEALDGNERVFREVADAARDRGLPWMQKRTSLEAVIYELRDGNGPWRRTPYLTAALWMKGEVAAAEAWLAHIASQFGAPPPEIPEPLPDVRVTRFGSSAPPRVGRATIRCLRDEIARGHGAIPRRSARGLASSAGLTVPQDGSKRTLMPIRADMPMSGRAESGAEARACSSSPAQHGCTCRPHGRRRRCRCPAPPSSTSPPPRPARTSLPPRPNTMSTKSQPLITSSPSVPYTTM